jgi:hypothetical protein
MPNLITKLSFDEKMYCLNVQDNHVSPCEMVLITNIPSLQTADHTFRCHFNDRVDTYVYGIKPLLNSYAKTGQ